MAKLISGNPNGTSILREGAATRKCPSCGLYTHQWEDIGDLTQSRIHGDWSVTTEGVQIVSKKFKAAFDGAGGTGAEFKLLSNGYFGFRPLGIVFLDVSQAELRAEDFCGVCGRLGTFLVTVRKLRLLKGQQEIGPKEVVRSFQRFGSQHFLAEASIFGAEIAEGLRKSRLTGGLQWYDCPES